MGGGRSGQARVGAGRCSLCRIGMLLSKDQDEGRDLKDGRPGGLKARMPLIREAENSLPRSLQLAGKEGGAQSALDRACNGGEGSRWLACNTPYLSCM